jgi:hypothetical protein
VELAILLERRHAVVPPDTRLLDEQMAEDAELTIERPRRVARSPRHRVAALGLVVLGGSVV